LISTTSVAIALIVLLDQLVWRPIILWADKFKFAQVESAKAATPSIISLLGRAALVIRGGWKLPRCR
jgi:NitT/TauT family transport system permease protein